LPRLPASWEGPCELVGAVVAAADFLGAPVSYSRLLAASGAAFMLRVSSEEFAHLDAARGRQRWLIPALLAAGFPKVRQLAPWPEAWEAVRAELLAGRPVIAAAYLPEAPWRAGLVVALAKNGLWSVMDSQGRVHTLAPRAGYLLALGPAGEPQAEPTPALLSRVLMAFEGEGECEGAGAWRNWLALLRRPPRGTSQDLALQLTAHEYLYENLLDARTHATLWLNELADQGEGVRAAWLQRSADHLAELVALLEARRPPVHHPETLACFGDPGWRESLARLLARAAELDLAAKQAIVSAVFADYPPEEEEV
jgi:hypothetical protein